MHLIFFFIILSCFSRNNILFTFILWLQTIDQPNVIVEGYFLGDLVYKNGSIPLTITGVLEACEKDESVYNALLLDTQTDLEAVKDVSSFCQLFSSKFFNIIESGILLDFRA